MMTKRIWRRTLAVTLGLALGWSAGGAFTGILPTQIQDASADCCPAEPSIADLTVSAQNKPAVVAQNPVVAATVADAAPAACPVSEGLQAKSEGTCAMPVAGEGACAMPAVADAKTDGACPPSACGTELKPGEVAGCGDADKTACGMAKQVVASESAPQTIGAAGAADSCGGCSSSKALMARRDPDAGQKAAQGLVPQNAEMPLFSSVMWAIGGLFVLALVLGPVLTGGKSGASTNASGESSSSNH